MTSGSLYLTSNLDPNMFIGEFYITVRYSFKLDVGWKYPVYEDHLVITHRMFEKIKTILLLRNTRYTIDYNKHYIVTVGVINIHLTEEYTKEMLNKDLGGFIGGWIKE